ncbi:MAG: TraC family protein [Candidatus Peribacteraceae bacterium]|nr:TraC family protein [Candidatus Peribacteraceae bacterium]
MDTIHQGTHKDPAGSTQLYLRIAEIHDDVVVLKNGGLRAVLEVDSVNVNLKSEDEQNALTAAYQNFLNSLEFPIQIVMRSKKLDISNYLATLKNAGKKQKNEILKNQITEYSEYIRRLVEFADIMEKTFYVVVPYDSVSSTSVSMFQNFWSFIHPTDTQSAFEKRKKEFITFNKKLEQNVEQVEGSLENCGLKTRRLATAELIQLFYGIYNPLTARNEKVDELTKLDLADAQVA